jgi:hypothetical protein
MKLMKDMKAGSVREPGVGMAEKNITRTNERDRGQTSGERRLTPISRSFA